MSEHIFIIGAVDKKLVIPFLLSIVYILYNLCGYFYEYNDSTIFVDYTGNSFGQILVLIIPCIFKIRKDEEERKKCTKENIKDYFFLILISFFYCAVEILSIYFVDDALCYLEGSEIIIIFIMTSLFMKYKYYMHHIISLIIFIIACIVIDIILNNFQNSRIESIFTQIACAIIEATWYCYIRYMIETKYHYYWNILFIIGVTNLILYSLTFVVLFSIKKLSNNPDILENLDYFSTDNIGNIILRFLIEFIPFGFIYYILEMITLSQFTINHIFACYRISKIPEIFIGIDNPLKWLSIIPIILQIISLLFYLEIFEYNFCDLNKNTKRNIQSREQADNLNLIKDDKSLMIEMAPGYYIHDGELK